MKHCCICCLTISILCAFTSIGEADSLSGTFAGAVLASQNGGIKIQVTFHTDGSADWVLPEGFVYDDLEEHVDYQFPPVTGTSGSYTYKASNGAVSINLGWSGNLQATNNSSMYCKMLNASGSKLTLSNASSSNRTISGSLYVTQQYFYTGHGTWNDDVTDPSFSMTSVAVPTPTPTENYDLVADGSIDARDLLEVLSEIHQGILPPGCLVDFSRSWKLAALRR